MEHPSIPLSRPRELSVGYISTKLTNLGAFSYQALPCFSIRFNYQVVGNWPLPIHITIAHFTEAQYIAINK